MLDAQTYGAITSAIYGKRFMNEKDDTLKSFKKLQKVVFLEETRDGFKYTLISSNHVEVVVCSDAALAANHDRFSRLIMLATARH